MTTRTAKDSKRQQKEQPLVRFTTRIRKDSRKRLDDYLKITHGKIQFVISDAIDDYVTRIGNPAR